VQTRSLERASVSDLPEGGGHPLIRPDKETIVTLVAKVPSSRQHGPRPCSAWIPLGRHWKPAAITWEHRAATPAALTFKFGCNASGSRPFSNDIPLGLHGIDGLSRRPRAF